MNYYIKHEFEKRNWKLYKSEDNQDTYVRNSEFFIVGRNNDDTFFVSYPLRESKYNYTTRFIDYEMMYTYMVDKLDYLDNYP